ncbi:hypothetical protein [Echinimonas agarilytica]|uniref:Uncharacterized protein n=1 Tax=Echinimonas agarilytica TaxID=1215918 RepID=A0AA41W835_9GAMM|nr:hypothetical protein [Echinimonas agarilytica]MCM2680660.1 hypothetical protein [Echinimonas agarilytica]
MFKPFFKATIAALIVTSPSALSEPTADTNHCATDSALVHATYALSSQAQHKPVHHQTLELRRQGDEVAQSYPKQEITEIWNLLKDGRTRPTRYFEHYKRGIEYYPEEIKSNKNKDLWETKYQFITNAQRSDMELVKSTGQGCKRTETYRQEKAGVVYELQWLPKLKLVKRYREISTVQAASQRSFEMNLKSLHTDELPIKQFFEDHAAYAMTDYADVGDNESDPFLMQMVNLGFIKGGHSGYYNTDGAHIEGGHHSH